MMSPHLYKIVSFERWSLRVKAAAFNTGRSFFGVRKQTGYIKMVVSTAFTLNGLLKTEGPTR